MSVNFNKLKQEILDEHNRVRKDPKSYVPILKKILTYFKGDVIYKPGTQVGIQTEEGQKVYQETIRFLEKQKPINLVTLNENLSRAAQDHVLDIGPKGLTDHDGSDGNSVTDRIERYLDWDVTVAENLDFGGKTGEEVLVSLMVDDGNPDRGHRKTIFNNDLKIIGIGIGKHSEYEICTCLDYLGAISREKQKSRAQDLGGLDDRKGGKRGAPETQAPKKESKAIQEVKVDLSPADFLYAPKKDLLKDDEDKPDNAIEVKVKTIIKKIRGETIIKVIKTYTLKDGSYEILEIEGQQ